MSDLFRSALGYLSNSAAAGGAAGPSATTNHGAYSSASGGAQDETSALGETFIFNWNKTQRNVRLQKLIAEGGFSYVFRGVELQSGEPIAVKKILAADAESVKAVEGEVEFMRQFKHEHIVTFFGSTVKASAKNLREYYLAMEFCPVRLPQPPFRLQHTAQIFGQTCRAIKYLHEFGIIHRDIKLENLLIGSEGLIKLVDFGSATMDKIYPTADWSMNKRTIVEEQIAAKTTPMYRAPEMLDLWSNYPIDERGDLWALGCLLFALNFGQHPFQDSNKLAIVNANYSLPKNVSDSGPIVSLIRGLLKVNPSERLSFGGLFEVLVSIAESGSFSLSAQLPFKAISSPNVTGGGIVNPLGSAGVPPPNLPSTAPPTQNLNQFPQQQSQGGSASLFSSLKGGAVSLIKNIKEQSQQYLVGPNTLGTVAPPPASSAGGPPPPRPLSAPNVQGGGSRGGPPPRPAPPSPLTQRREGGGAQPTPARHIEFENREYEAMMRHKEGAPTRPAPPKPPPPKVAATVVEPPKVANLLDIGFEGSGPSQGLESGGGTSTADLLGDLFGGGGGNAGSVPRDGFGGLSSSSGGEEFLWGGTPTTSVGGGADALGDLMGDPFASLLGKSVPSSSMPTRGIPHQQGANPTTLGAFGAFASSQPFLQPTTGGGTGMPSSTSFQNLVAHGGKESGVSGAGSLLDTGGGRIPKNSSSPNLLSDLILDDIMGTGGAGGGSLNKMNLGGGSTSTFNKSNPSINQQGGVAQPPPPNNNTRPNYNRTQIFDPPPPPPAGSSTGGEKGQRLDDVFADILNSQGFAAGGKEGTGRTINDLRKIEMLASPNANPTQIKVNEWREGKKKNIRALLASLHTVTWEECSWEETNMSQMISGAQVKKTYRKACLAIHPDKQMGREWEELAKLIFVELNEAWAAFEETQQL